MALLDSRPASSLHLSAEFADAEYIASLEPPASDAGLACGEASAAVDATELGLASAMGPDAPPPHGEAEAAAEPAAASKRNREHKQPRRLKMAGGAPPSATAIAPMDMLAELPWDSVLDSALCVPGGDPTGSLKSLFDEVPVRSSMKTTGRGKSKSRMGKPKKCNCKSSRCVGLHRGFKHAAIARLPMVDRMAIAWPPRAHYTTGPSQLQVRQDVLRLLLGGQLLHRRLPLHRLHEQQGEHRRTR